MVGICKRGPTGATGACTFPPSHKVPIVRFNFRVYDLGGFSQYSVFTRYVLYEICMIHSNTSKPPQYCHIRHNTAEYVARADHTRPHVGHLQLSPIMGPMWQSARYRLKYKWKSMVNHSFLNLSSESYCIGWAESQILDFRICTIIPHSFPRAI